MSNEKQVTQPTEGVIASMEAEAAEMLADVARAVAESRRGVDRLARLIEIVERVGCPEGWTLTWAECWLRWEAQERAPGAHPSQAAPSISFYGDAFHSRSITSRESAALLKIVIEAVEAVGWWDTEGGNA